jgi:hypothetical protein
MAYEASRKSAANRALGKAAQGKRPFGKERPALTDPAKSKHRAEKLGDRAARTRFNPNSF